jgi:hypothetical protein
MAKKQRIVRIKYDHDRPRIEEVYNLLRFIACIIVAIVMLVVSLSVGTFYFMFFGVAIFSLLSVIPFQKYWHERSIRKRDYADAKFIIDHGEKVIGSIVSMNTIKLDEEFTYEIEYEWKGDEMPIRITTPTVLKSRMNIKEKDLPLKVVLYAMNNRAHAYAVIDPPIAKMKIRWMFRYLHIILVVLLLIAFVVCSFMGLHTAAITLFYLSLLFAALATGIEQDIK